MILFSAKSPRFGFKITSSARGENENWKRSVSDEVGMLTPQHTTPPREAIRPQEIITDEWPAVHYRTRSSEPL